MNANNPSPSFNNYHHTARLVSSIPPVAGLAVVVVFSFRFMKISFNTIKLPILSVQYNDF